MADESVFSGIATLPWPQLAESVYLLLLAIGQRKFLTSEQLKDKLDAASSGSSADRDGNLRGLVDSSLRAIETAEHKSLSEISDAEIGGYQRLLSELLSRSTKADLANSNLSGSDLLKQLSA